VARSLAEAYHLLTKYTERNVRATDAIDWREQPKPFKEIVSNRRLPLRDYLPFRRDLYTGLEFEPAPSLEEEGPGLPRIARMLFFGGGVTGVVQFEGGGGLPLRAAPSAGGLYPTEIYLAAEGVPGLEPGLYNYQANAHELVRLWEGSFLDEILAACAAPPDVGRARAWLVLTGVFWRSAWRYQERGYRRVLLDAGHVLGNLVAYAPHEDVSTIPCAAFRDSALNGLFFFEESVEAALVCLPLLEGVSESEPGPLHPSPPSRVERLQAVRIASERDLARSATAALHRGSACGGLSGGEPRTPAREPLSPNATWIPRGEEIDDRVPDAILRRRSARAYDGGSVSLEALGACLSFAFGRGDDQGLGRPCRFATHDAGVLEARLLALAVDGLAPGVYAVEGFGEALAPVAFGDFRASLFHVALDQPIAGRCAAALAFTAPAKAAIARWGDRAYRYLHLDAGHIGERFQIAASALGLGACGIAGFFDDEAADLLQIGREEFTLYFVTLGRA